MLEIQKPFQNGGTPMPIKDGTIKLSSQNSMKNKKVKMSDGTSLDVEKRISQIQAHVDQDKQIISHQLKLSEAAVHDGDKEFHRGNVKRTEIRINLNNDLIEGYKKELND